MASFSSFYHCTIIIGALLSVTTSAFTPSTTSNNRKITLQMVSRDEFLRPHFQAIASVSTGAANSRQRGGLLRPSSNSVTTTSTFRSPSAPFLEQRVQDYCDNKGGCDLEEMEQLMEEFQKVNQSHSSALLPFESRPQLKQADEVSAPTHVKNADMKQYLRRMHDIAEQEEF